MNESRYNELVEDVSLKLTKEEIEEGWVFCCEFDGLLIHKDHPEAEYCLCLEEKFNNQ